MVVCLNGDRICFCFHRQERGCYDQTVKAQKISADEAAIVMTTMKFACRGLSEKGEPRNCFCQKETFCGAEKMKPVSSVNFPQITTGEKLNKELGYLIW